MTHPIPGSRAGGRPPGLLLGGFLALLAAVFLNAAAPNPAAAQKGDDKDSSPPSPAANDSTTMEARFSDNSQLKLTLRMQTVALQTRYGSLSIPLGDILKIDFATRIPPQVAKQIETALKNLSHADFKERDRARNELVRIGPLAHAALVEAAKSDDAEVKRGAEEVIAKIKESASEDQLVVRQHDVIHTRDSKITGKIETSVFKAHTVPFGEVQVKIADIRGLRSLRFAEPENDKLAALPDPGSLGAYGNQFGTKLAFNVTGRVDGAIWGTNVYTLDTTLATAAVHAGVLQVGQTGVVKVQIVQSPPGFIATAQNGVNSQAWGIYPGGAYQILKAR